MKSWTSRIAVLVTAVSVTALVGPITNASAVTTPIIDTSYGTQGATTISVPKQLSASVIIDTVIDGSGNTIALVNMYPKAAIARYALEGSRDATFGDGSGSTTPITIASASIAVQADGKIVLAGIDYTKSPAQLVVFRYLATGKIDASFATKGRFSLAGLPKRDFNSSKVSVAIDNVSRRIFLGTTIGNGLGSNNNFYFVALTRSGQIDYDWNNGGTREIIQATGGVSAPSNLFSITVVPNEPQQPGDPAVSGSLLAVGTSYQYGRNIVLAKMNENGYLDGQFDGATEGAGIVIVDFPGNSDAQMTSISLLPDGDIALAGYAGNYYYGPWYYAMAKFNSDGTIDANFGTDGFLLTTMAAHDLTASQGSPNFWPQDVRTLVRKTEGSFYFPVYAAGAVALMKVESDGSSAVVENVAGDGQTVMGQAVSVALQNQKTVIGGSTSGTYPTSLLMRATDEGLNPWIVQSDEYREAEIDHEIVKLVPQSDGTVIGLASASPMGLDLESRQQGCIFKLNANGTIDTSFANLGFALLSHPDFESIEPLDVVIQNDGKAIVAFNASRLNRNLLLMRINTNGSVDLSFGDSGFVEYDSGIEDQSVSVNIDDQQRIMVANNIWSNQSSAQILRFSSQGVLDEGYVPTAINAALGASIEISKMKIDADNRYLVIGSVDNNGQTMGFIARLMSDGALDSSFSSDGFTLVDLNHPNTVDPYSRLEDLAISPSGRIAAIGSSNTPNNNEAIVYFTQDGIVDTTVADGTGVSLFDSDENAAYSRTNSIESDGDGFLVVGGGSEFGGYSETNWGIDSAFATVLRFSSNGLLDTTFDADGRYFPTVNDGASFFHVVRINEYQFLTSGLTMVGGVRKGLVMRIGTIPPEPVVETSPSTVVAETTAPSTTSTTAPAVLPPQTTVPVAVVSLPTVTTTTTTTPSPTPLKLVISVSHATILQNMKLTVPKGGVATFAIAKSSAKVCKVVKKQVVGTAAGTCRVSVTIKVKAKKNVTKSMMFKVSG
jgi:uncharacterized delta-60 repeat protein